MGECGVAPQRGDITGLSCWKDTEILNWKNYEDKKADAPKRCSK